MSLSEDKLGRALISSVTTAEVSLLCLVILLAALLLAPVLRSQSLDPIQQPAVGIQVIHEDNSQQGSGFVISVDNETAYILTARHLFYSGERQFHNQIRVTFYLDPLKEYPAAWFADFPNLDLAVIKVALSQLPRTVASLLKDIPIISVRPSAEPPKLKEDIFIVGGSFQEWELPKDTITSLQNGPNDLDAFRFTGIGVHDGFSGSAILDSLNRLVGVHLGAVALDESYGRARRIGDALSILSTKHIPMNKLDTSRTTSKLDKHAIDPIVAVKGNLVGQPTSAAGIIFWRGNGAFYVATANHVVRRDNKEAVGLQVRLSNRRDEDLAATLEPRFSTELDLAVLKVTYPTARSKDFCSLSLDQLAESNASKKRDHVYPIGNPADLPWWVPVSPSFISEVSENEIAFAFPFIAQGYSGGGLFDDKSRLVGMITADDHPPYGTALEIRKLVRILEGWDYLTDLNAHNGGGNIHKAIRSQRLIELQAAFASACSDLERTDAGGATPLAAASALGWKDGVQLLLKAGGDVNGKTGSVTPLVAAVKNHHPKIVDVLLAKHADPNLGGPLVLAITSHQPEVAQRLLGSGSDPNTGDPAGAAITAGDAVTLRLLLGPYKAELKGGVNLLLYPIAHYDVEILRVLISEHGVPVNDYIGEDTPLMIAAQSSTPEVVQFLLGQGAKLNERKQVVDGRAANALQVAVMRGSLAIVKILVDAGANLQSEPPHPSPPLELAYANLKSKDLERQAIFDFLLNFKRTAPRDRGILLNRVLTDGNYELAKRILMAETDVIPPKVVGPGAFFMFADPARILAADTKFKPEEKCVLKLIIERRAKDLSPIPKERVDGFEATCRSH